MADTATKERPKTKEAPKRVLPAVGSIQLTESARTEYQVSVDRDVVLQDLINPSFWKHHTRLRPGDKVDVDCEDLSWCARLVVRAKPGNALVMGVISFSPFTAEAREKGDLNKMVAAQDLMETKDDGTPKYVIQWNNKNKRFMVRPNEPGSEWIGDGHVSQLEADKWVRNQEAALRR